MLRPDLWILVLDNQIHTHRIYITLVREHARPLIYPIVTQISLTMKAEEAEELETFKDDQALLKGHGARVDAVEASEDSPGLRVGQGAAPTRRSAVLWGLAIPLLFLSFVGVRLISADGVALRSRGCRSAIHDLSPHTRSANAVS